MELTPICRLRHVFHCDLLFKAYSFKPLRHQPTEIESDYSEYAIDYISEYRMLKSISGLIVVVLIFKCCLMLLDMMSLSGCFLNKWMIANNYQCSSRGLFGLNNPKHKLMFNLKPNIFLERLI